MATSRRFSERFKGKIRVIYNGIDIQWLKDKRVCRAKLQGQNSRIILVVARVSKWKRHDLALSAFEGAAKVYPDLQLVLVGAKDPFEPEWWNYLQKRTVDSNYTERIHWVGHIEDVRPWYRAASILLLPSDSEAFGRVLVEAMACGVPVVGSWKGGIPEIVRNGQDGILVAKREARLWSEAMMTILNDDRIKQKYIRSGKERANIFNLESHVINLAKVFDDLGAA
jgi:mannosyltransferase